MQIDARLLRTSVPHQGSDHGQIDTSIHQMRCVGMAEHLRRDLARQARLAGGQPHNVTGFPHPTTRFLWIVRNSGPGPLGPAGRCRPADRCIPLRERARVAADLLAMTDEQFLSLEIDVRQTQLTQFARAQSAAVEQQHDQAIPPCPLRVTAQRTDEVVGFLLRETRRFLRSTHDRVLQLKSVQHVPLRPVAPPGVIERDSACGLRTWPTSEVCFPRFAPVRSTTRRLPTATSRVPVPDTACGASRRHASANSATSRTVPTAQGVNVGQVMEMYSLPRPGR